MKSAWGKSDNGAEQEDSPGPLTEGIWGISSKVLPRKGIQIYVEMFWLCMYRGNFDPVGFCYDYVLYAQSWGSMV